MTEKVLFILVMAAIITAYHGKIKINVRLLHSYCSVEDSCMVAGSSFQLCSPLSESVPSFVRGCAFL